jgi:2-desacetyl-2-hydroxyethyl bacteriochlorophyllide A dehydrogenase
MLVTQLVAPHEMILAERRAPEPGVGEVRIAVHVVGICGTDMEFYSGRRENGYPFILGHECAGTIDALGTGVTGWNLGDRVTVRPNFGCGVCDRCHEGRTNICPNSRGLGVTIDGCLAETIIAPAEYVFKLPQGIGFEEGALIEPMAVACRAVRRADVMNHHRVLILGAGAIGLFAVQWAVHEGAEVTVCDPIPERLALARQFGATETVQSVTDLATPSGMNFDAVIETAGISQTVPTAVTRTRPGGRVVLTGIPMDSAQVETKWIVWRELEIVGSFIYEATDFSRAAKGIRDEIVRALDVVTHRFPFACTADAFELIADRGGLKALINIRQEEA